MVLRPENLPRDPDRLIEMVLACEGKIEALQATITTLKTMIFGARSEKSAVIIAEQLSLGLGDAETDAALPPPANDDHKTKAAPGSRNKRNRNIGALRRDDRAGDDSVSLLHRRAPSHRRGRQRGAR